MTIDDIMGIISALLATFEKGCGIVSDIEIDLRHELLDPADWKSHLIGLRPPRGELFIWFPWSEFFDEESSWEPDCCVYPGDKITIDEVDRYSLGDCFDHLDDSEIRVAYLRIERANGDVEHISKPITFFGISSLTMPALSGSAFSRLASRIDEFMSHSRDDVGKMSNTYVAKALCSKLLIERRSKDVRKRIYVGNDPSDRKEAIETWSLVNEAIRMGYFWAKVEAEFHLKPLAEKNLASKLGGALGGKKSIESKEKVKDDEWRNRAREHIAESFRNNPVMGQDDRATIILDKLRAEQRPSLPSHGQLVKLIAKIKKDASLSG